MNEFSENTVFMVNSLESQLTNGNVNIENFRDTLNSVFEERKNVLKSADEAIIDNFKNIMKIGGKTDATATTMISKLSKDTRPFTREYAVMFCYAAGYKTEKADSQLQKIFLVDGFHLRNYEDLIYSFFLQNNSLENCVENYTKAYEMKERFKEMYKCAELKVPVENLANENPGQYTEFFEKECAKLETVEQLEIFLSSEDTLNKAGNINRTAKSYMYDVVFELCSRIIERIADNENLDDTGNIQKCSDDLLEIYDEEDSKKLCERVVKLLNSILNPSVYFDLRGIDSCFNPKNKYYEMSLSGISEKDWPQCALNKKREYLEYQRKSAKIVGFFNANYNNIENGFNKAVKNRRFDKLIEYLSTVNGEDKENVLKKLHTVYRESMFNVLMYDYWGLRIYLGLPLETSLSEFILPEKLEPRSSVYPRNPSIVENEAHFIYAPEFSKFVVQYITAAANGEYVNIRRNEGAQIKPFVIQINSVQDLCYIAVSTLDKPTMTILKTLPTI